MADYKKMYFTLFNEVSRAIEILRNAQCQAEEAYSSSEDMVLKIAKGKTKEMKRADAHKK